MATTSPNTSRPSMKRKSDEIEKDVVAQNQNSASRSESVDDGKQKTEATPGKKGGRGGKREGAGRKKKVPQRPTQAPLLPIQPSPGALHATDQMRSLYPMTRYPPMPYITSQSTPVHTAPQISSPQRTAPPHQPTRLEPPANATNSAVPMNYVSQSILPSVSASGSSPASLEKDDYLLGTPTMSVPVEEDSYEEVNNLVNTLSAKLSRCVRKETLLRQQNATLKKEKEDLLWRLAELSKQKEALELSLEELRIKHNLDTLPTVAHPTPAPPTHVNEAERNGAAPAVEQAPSSVIHNSHVASGVLSGKPKDILSDAKMMPDGELPEKVKDILSETKIQAPIAHPTDMEIDTRKLENNEVKTETPEHKLKSLINPHPQENKTDTSGTNGTTAGEAEKDVDSTPNSLYF